MVIEDYKHFFLFSIGSLSFNNHSEFKLTGAKIDFKAIFTLEKIKDIDKEFRLDKPG